MTTVPPSILYLTTFGHRYGPLLPDTTTHTPPYALIPAPSLTVDIRSLPNPPRTVRATYRTGMFLQFREAFFLNPAARERLAEVERDVRALLRPTSQNGAVLLDSEEGETETETGGGKVVSVAVRCEMGKHRSVAFVEDLVGRLRQSGDLEGWEVVVTHRDMERKKEGKPKRDRRRSGAGLDGSCSLDSVNGNGTASVEDV